MVVAMKLYRKMVHPNNECLICLFVVDLFCCRIVRGDDAHAKMVRVLRDWLINIYLLHTIDRVRSSYFHAFLAPFRITSIRSSSCAFLLLCYRSGLLLLLLLLLFVGDRILSLLNQYYLHWSERQGDGARLDGLLPRRFCVDDVEHTCNVSIFLLSIQFGWLSVGIERVQDFLMMIMMKIDYKISGQLFESVDLWSAVFQSQYPCEKIEKK